MNGLSERERRLVALGLLTAVIALAWFAVAAPILNGFADRRVARAAAEAELAQNARLIAAFPALKAQAAAERRAASSYALDAASAPAATEIARTRLARMVAADGGLLQALRNQPAPPRQVRLQADVRIGLNGLTNLIRRLENDRPYATFNGLLITAPDPSGAGSAPPLEARLDVSYSYLAPR